MTHNENRGSDAPPLSPRWRRLAAGAGSIAFWSLLGLGCDASSPPVDPEAAPRPNVIFIAIDTVGAAHLSAYGYERPTSPAIDAFAREGVLFEEAYSQAGYTLPSFAATFTGSYVSNSGALRPAYRIHSSRTTLAEVLEANGYRTVGLHAGGFVSPGYGFERGFDEYRETSSALDASNFTVPAMEWLEDNDDLPFFMFLHTYDAHSPYGTSPPEYHALFTDPDYVDSKQLKRQANWLETFAGTVNTQADVDYIRALYDGEIRYVDDQLRGFFDYLKRSGLWDTTYVVLFADHGEEFQEHEHFGHIGCVHPEIVRVPLIVTGPGVVGGRRVRGITRLIDLFPTLLELLELDSSDVKQSLDGSSFAAVLAAVAGDEAAARGGDENVAISQHLGFFNDREELYSLRTPDWAMVRKSRHRLELYDRRADPEEQVNRWRDHSELADELEARYHALVGAHALEGELERSRSNDAKRLQDNLRALGYVDDSLEGFRQSE